MTALGQIGVLVLAFGLFKLFAWKKTSSCGAFKAGKLGRGAGLPWSLQLMALPWVLSGRWVRGRMHSVAVLSGRPVWNMHR